MIHLEHAYCSPQAGWFTSDFYSRLMPVTYTSYSSLPTCTHDLLFQWEEQVLLPMIILLSLDYCLISKTIAIRFLLCPPGFDDSFSLVPQQDPIPPATSLSECHLPPCTAGRVPALKRIHVQLYKLKLYFTWYKSNCGDDFLLIRINVWSNIYSFESKFNVKHHHCWTKFIPLFIKSKCALWTGLLFLPFSRDFHPTSGQGFCCLWQPQVPRRLAAESCALSRRRTVWSSRPAW